MKLEVQNVMVNYQMKRTQQTVTALQSVSLEVPAGQFVAIVGLSGCGKTTLLNAIAGLLPVTTGRIVLDGKVIDKPGRDRAVVFQTPALLSWRSVLRNVSYGLELQGIKCQEASERAQYYLRKEDHIQVGDRVGLLQSCNFGAAISDVWGTLLNGATVAFYDVSAQGINGLSAWLRNQAITTLHIPTELHRQLLDSLTAEETFPALRILAPSGRIYRRDLERSWAHLSLACVVTSRFSSSETGRSTRMEISRSTQLDSNIVPVGYPLDGVELSLHNEDGTPVLAGEAGQIWVRSRYLPIGHWHSPELTQKTYLVDPSHPEPSDNAIRICRTGDWGRLRPDGCFELLGRKDARVKVRGYRIDLSEVEAALYALPSIRAAAVTTHQTASHEPYIIAYHIPVLVASTSVSDLRRQLGESLPSYMIPSFFGNYSGFEKKLGF